MKLLIFLIWVPMISLAAVPERLNTGRSSVLKVLQAPHKYAVQEMFSRGPQGYKELYSIAFTPSYSMPTRWKSFMIMTSIGRGKSLPEMKKALNSSDWFMRSAGLLALEKVDQAAAIKWAKKFFLKDKAMMVRAKAIDILRNRPTASLRKMMWKKLYSKDNYHRNKGLWIRKKILSYLVDYGDRSDLEKIKKILYDRDSRLYPIAIAGLERITGKKSAENISAKARLDFWKKTL